MKKYIVLPLLALSFGVLQAEDNPAVEAIQEYLDFAEYSEGSISTEQLASIDYKNIFFVDVRSKRDYDRGHIPDAVNIEWREILSRRDEIPTDKPVIIYCEIGILSSRAHLALKMAGKDNVKVLWGGYHMWSAGQNFE